MKVLKLAFLFLLASLSFHVQGQDTDQLEKLLENYVTAVNELDLELAQSIWSQTEEISFIQPRGHQVGWNDIQKAFYIGAMGNFKKRDLKLKNVTIRILSNDTAWADFYWDFDAVFHDDTPITTSGRETQVWKKEADGWKIVHVHYSGLPVTGEREGF